MKVVIYMYLFLFVCLFKVHATQPQPKVQQQPKDCVKYPKIIQSQPATTKVVVTDKFVKTSTSKKTTNLIPNFSVFNFINFFYSKDTLDNLHTM